MSKKEEKEQPSIITAIKTFFHFAIGNKKKFDHEGLANKLTNQIIKILSNKEHTFTPKEIIDKCYLWLDNKLQPLASTLGYLVKNTIITVTIPFSLLFNDVTTVIMAIKQIESFFFELKNFNIENIIFENNKPEANFLSPYIEHSDAELANLNKKLDELNFIRIQLKNMISKIVDLIIVQLKEEINNKKDEDKKNNTDNNSEIIKKISEFIIELESSKEDKSNEVATSVFTTFVNVIFGYKSVEKKGTRQQHAGKIRHLFLRQRRTKTRWRQRRTKTRWRQRRTKTRGRQRRTKTRRRHAFFHP